MQVRKGSAVNEFWGWLIEKMAEVYTRTSNHEIISEAGPRCFECLAFEPFTVVQFTQAIESVGPAVTFRAVDTQMRCMEWASEASHTPCISLLII